MANVQSEVPAPEITYILGAYRLMDSYNYTTCEKRKSKNVERAAAAWRSSPCAGESTKSSGAIS